MNPTCLYLPLLDGKRSQTAQFLTELTTERAADYDTSQRHLEVTKEVWFIANHSSQPVLVAYVESSDFATAVARMSASTTAFDRWFKDNLLQCTGLDLDNPPPLTLPELFAHYQTQE